MSKRLVLKELPRACVRNNCGEPTRGAYRTRIKYTPTRALCQCSYPQQGVARCSAGTLFLFSFVTGSFPPPTAVQCTSRVGGVETWKIKTVVSTAKTTVSVPTRIGRNAAGTAHKNAERVRMRRLTSSTIRWKIIGFFFFSPVQQIMFSARRRFRARLYSENARNNLFAVLHTIQRSSSTLKNRADMFYS